MCMLQCTWEGRRTTYRHQFSPYTMWVPKIELRSRLGAKCFDLMRYLTGPQLTIIIPVVIIR